MGAKAAEYGDAWLSSCPSSLEYARKRFRDGRRSSKKRAHVWRVSLTGIFDPTQGSLTVNVDPSWLPGAGWIELSGAFPYECVEANCQPFSAQHFLIALISNST